MWTLRIRTLVVGLIMAVGSLGAQETNFQELSNKANRLYQQGTYREASRVFEQAMAVAQQTWGEEHPETLTVMNNLAETLRAQGELAAARQLHEQVLAVRRRVLGPEHPHTLNSMKNLAQTLKAQEDQAATGELE
ncbi:MAG: tetratricopeptide repeat protein [bacterium]|nr:tetratricopeptide repeat protein [bacterium]